MSDSPADSPTPVSLKSEDDTLKIGWSDGVTQTYTWKVLRDNCPCATCRNTHGPPAEAPDAGLLPVLSLAETQPVRGVRMTPVGNYAYGIEFSDGHSTGIYPLELLRDLGS